MFYKVTILILIQMLVSITLLAAGDGATPQNPHIFAQFFNFTCTILILVFFLKKPIRAFFTANHQEFVEKSQASKKEKDRAIEAKEDILKKIDEFESQYSVTIQKAKDSSAKQKQALLDEVHLGAQKIVESTEKKIQSIRMKEKDALKNRLITAAMEKAKLNVSKPEIQHSVRINSDFMSEARTSI